MMVSVIIPLCNSEKTISDYLSSLSVQSYKSDYEIILVDSSSDKTPSIVRSQFPRIQYFQFAIKTDPGTARNCGMKNSRGDLIIFIDSDCIAEKDWIYRHVQFHKDRPEVAAIGGSVINGNDSKGIVSWFSYFGEFLPQNPENFTFHIPTLNISYKKWVFEKYGFFDPNFYPQKDLVFNYLITKKGEKIFVDPLIKVRYTHRIHLRPFLRHQYNIGSKTSQVLKVIPLPGHHIAKNKALFIMVNPALPFIKFFRTLMVILSYEPIQVIQRALSIVVLKVGLIFWFFGFSHGFFSREMGGVR